MKLIDKSALVAEIERQISAIDNCPKLTDTQIAVLEGNKVVLTKLLSFLDTLEVKEVDLELENENNNTKITIGTKIRLKTNPDVILSIISDDCHEDEFECSNGSVLSLKQIEKYYDIYIEEK